MGLFGVKSVRITSTRGFCIELATALVVIVSARFGVLGAWPPAALEGAAAAVPPAHALLSASLGPAASLPQGKVPEQLHT